MQANVAPVVAAGAVVVTAGTAGGIAGYCINGGDHC